MRSVELTQDRTLLRLFAVPGPVFEAKYRGKCAVCGQRFPVGERICYIAKKTVAHEGCNVSRVPVNPFNDPVLGAEEWTVQYGLGRKIDHAPVSAGAVSGGAG